MAKFAFYNGQSMIEMVFCLKKLFWSTVRKICSSDREIFLKFEAEGQEFQKFFSTLEQFFLTVGQNNFGNKIPYFSVIFGQYPTKMLTVQWFYS